MQVLSPSNFSESVLIIVYAPDSDNITVSDRDGNSWDSRRDSISTLESGMFSEVSISYFPDHEYLLFYFAEDNASVDIVAESEMSYFFAEVGDDGRLTDNNTGNDNSLMPPEGMSVTRKGRRLELSLNEKYPVNIPQDDPAIMQPQDEIQELKDEIQRLQRVITQISDEAFHKMYSLVNDVKINEITAELYKKKKEYESLCATCDDLRQQLESLNAKRTELDRQAENLRSDLAKAEEINSTISSDISGMSEELERILSSLGIDVDALAMYKGNNEVDEILSEAEKFAEKVRETLRKNVEIRQKLCRDKHENIAGN